MSKLHKQQSNLFYYVRRLRIGGRKVRIKRIIVSLTAKRNLKLKERRAVAKINP
jgi:hypothetical protein